MIKDTTKIQFSIDTKLKKKAEANLELKGLNIKDAVKMFIIGIANQDINVGIFPAAQQLNWDEEKELIKLKNEFVRDEKKGKTYRVTSVKNLKKRLENE